MNSTMSSANHVKDSWEDEEEIDTYIMMERFAPPSTRKRRLKKPKKLMEEKGSYRILHQDIWFLIGEHLAPETVQAFALVCRASHAVTHTAHFWLSLYNRYHTSDHDLPPELRRAGMDHQYGLRARVIKALYLFYPPFITRVRANRTFSGLEKAQGRICTNMWFDDCHDEFYIYYFCFRWPELPKCNLQGLGDSDNLLVKLADICANSEEGTCVLQIVTDDYVPLPSATGLLLRNISSFMMSGMTHYRVQLRFEGQPQQASVGGAVGDFCVNVQPARSARCFHWWEKTPSLRHPRSRSTSS